MRVWLTLATNGPRGRLASIVILAAAANPGPSLNTTSHTLPWLPTFPPAAHKEAQSLPGSFQSHHVHRVSRTGASSPALGTSPNTVHTRTHACSAPPLFYFFTASLSQLHFQWHAKATPGHPLRPYSASSSCLFRLDFLLPSWRQDVQQLTNPGEHEQPEAKRLFEAVLTTPFLFFFVVLVLI